MRLVAALALFVLSWADSPAAAPPRVALVVGVSAYDSPDIAALPNAVNDARAIDAKLRTLGFDTRRVENPTRSELSGALTALFDRRRALNAETALVYFAGHGVQFNGAGHLLSRDSTLAPRDEMELQQEVSISDLLRQVAEAKLAILLLDACRTTPAFEARLAWRSGNSVAAGLPPVSETTTAAVISYSAQPGKPALDSPRDGGPNSPYALALLDYLGRPGLELGALLQGVQRFVFSETGRAQSPVYEDRRPPGFSFYFREAGLASAPMPAPLEEPRPPEQPDRVSAREALALLAGKSGAARGQALKELLTSPGLLTPVSGEQAVALLGDIPVEAGRRRRAVAMLMPLLPRPVRPDWALSLLEGLSESGRLAALSDMMGCLARPVPEDAARELLEGIPRQDIAWAHRALTSPSSSSARCGAPP